MGDKTLFKKTCSDLAKKLEFECSVNKTHAFFRDGLAPLSINFELLDTEDSNVFVYFYVRTTSWEFPGERTDLHEMISTLLATFLRIELNLSCVLVDIPNPVVEVPETEIYARYIVPEQPDNATYALTGNGTSRLEQLFAVVRLFELMLPMLFDWSPEEINGELVTTPNHDWLKAAKWAGVIANAIGEPWVDCEWPDSIEELMALDENGPTELGGSEKVEFSLRTNPNWKYYRSIASGVTVYEAPSAAKILSERINASTPWKSLKGVDSVLYLSDSTRNAIRSEDLNLARKVLRIVKETEAVESPICIPLEHDFVIVANKHLVIMRRDCGKKSFETEREKVRNRHEVESELLFPLVNFRWNEKLDDSKFENLILDLLKREPGVRRARLVSVAKERDGGKDILCEWFTPLIASDKASEKQPPAGFRRVIVQCKAYNKPVNKANVTDIRDTVMHHEASGYFLAVSSQITTTLTDHLDNLRRKGDIWVDWWTRSELEERLNRNQDIARKYPMLVQFD